MPPSAASSKTCTDENAFLQHYAGIEPTKAEGCSRALKYSVFAAAAAAIPGMACAITFGRAQEALQGEAEGRFRRYRCLGCIGFAARVGFGGPGSWNGH